MLQNNASISFFSLCSFFFRLREKEILFATKPVHNTHVANQTIISRWAQFYDSSIRIRGHLRDNGLT